MTLELRPFGTFKIFPAISSQAPGPIAFRSASRLDSGSWENDVFGKVQFHFGMGAYLQAPGGAHVSVRVAMQTADGTRFYMEYISRGEMSTHLEGKTPLILAGQIEIDPANAKYAWLNHTHLVGRGMLTWNPLVQTYEMYVLG